MLRMIIRFAIVLAIAAGLTWIADRPGSVTIDWLGRQIEIPVVFALLGVVALAFILWLMWRIVSRIWHAPGDISGFFGARREKKGRRALSRGIIAVGAGDARAARQNANIARSILGDEPLTKVLEAQTAQMRGEHDKVRQLFQDMAAAPETELLGLRGLHAQAVRDGDEERSQEIARRAFDANPALPWASSAVLLSRSRKGDWPAVVSTLEAQRRAGTIDEEELRSKRAVVLAAQAIKAEENDRDAALDLASRAHRLDPALVPAAVTAGRIHAQQGNLRKASKILEKTWSLSPHPDIAEVYIYARNGDSAQDRLKRMRDLLKVSRGGEEGAVALASAAIDAHDWKTARTALAEFTEAPRVRVCQLMAEIEEGEFGDKGRAREWLARAVRARRDPAWTADGHVSERWHPVSPVTFTLGGFTWKVPVEGIGYSEAGEDEETAGEAEAPAVEEVDEPEDLPGDFARDITPPAPPPAPAPSPAPAAKAAPAPAEPAPEPKQAAAKPETGPAAATPEPVAPPAPPPPAPKPAAEMQIAPDGQPVDEPPRPIEASTAEEIDTANGETRPVPRQPDDPGPEADSEENGSRKRWFG